MGSSYSDWLALLGFYSETDARSVLTGHGLRLDEKTEDALVFRIKKARAHVSTISGRAHLEPKLETIPPGHEAHLEELGRSKAMRQTVGSEFSAWSFQMIELAKIHVHQPYIHLEYASKLLEKVPGTSDPGALLRYCLPLRSDPSNQTVVVSFERGRNSYSIASENLDLQVTGTSQGVDDKGNFVGFNYGFGLPQIFVVRFHDLLILKNGYHRAYTLLKKGHRFIPCVVVETDDFSLTGAGRPGLFSRDVILSDRSPIVSDYLTDAALVIPRPRVKARVTVNATTKIVPE